MFSLRIKTPPASLLAMVGRLAVASPPTPSAPGGLLQTAQPSGAVAHALLAPPQTELNVHALASTLHAKQQQQQQQQQQHVLADGAAAAGMVCMCECVCVCEFMCAWDCVGVCLEVYKLHWERYLERERVFDTL